MLITAGAIWIFGLISLEIFYPVAQSNEWREAELISYVLDALFLSVVPAALGVIVGTFFDTLLFTTELHVFAMSLGLLFGTIFINKRFQNIYVSYKLYMASR